MSYFFALILVGILVWILFGDRIKRWAQRRMMEKMEDAFRARMGMPSAKEERRQRRRAEQEARKAGATSTGRGKRSYWTHADAPRDTSDSSASHANRQDNSPIIPKEYAEDVEYVEYKEFSASATIIAEEPSPKGDAPKYRKKTTTIIESQISDVEFTEIKSK